MLGLGSVEIALVYWLCLAATALCVVYGIVNWNERGSDAVSSSTDEVLKTSGGKE
ncbi:symporter small accessory protein [Pseudodesulfovibrio senegalensis]|jgi:hypothetical protein|uniref:symporter small accessory protein n=1 Tax=Pseudodesulfovibrio senegalensis TaxID=1721087 RepID=UPI0030C7C635